MGDVEISLVLMLLMVLFAYCILWLIDTLLEAWKGDEK